MRRLIVDVLIFFCAIICGTPVSGESMDPEPPIVQKMFNSESEGKHILPPHLLRRWIGEHETIINIMEFGASGDGRTDDTEAFAVAIAKLETGGGGILEIPLGDYAVAINITRGHVWVRCAPGTILRAASSRAVFRVAPMAEQVVLTDADIRGRTKTAEASSSRKPTALHGIEIRGVDVILDRVRAEGFRVDSLYLAGNARNIYLNDSAFGDTARNSVSIVNGRNINFYGGIVWNAGNYSYGGYSSLYLFDIEPGRSQSVDNVSIFGTVFEGNSPVSGAGLVIISDGNNASGRTNIMLQGTTHRGSNGSAGALRLLNRNAGIIKGITLRRASFAKRAVANTEKDATIVEDSLFEDIEVGNGGAVYGAWIGNGTIVKGLRSSTGTTTALPVAKGAAPIID